MTGECQCTYKDEVLALTSVAQLVGHPQSKRSQDRFWSGHVPAWGVGLELAGGK